MDLTLPEEQLLLRESASRLFAAESTPAIVRESEGTNGFAPGLWRQLVEFGLPGMRVPAAQGGSGLSLFDAVLAAEEAGRHLAPVPLAESVAAGSLLARLPGQAAREVRDALVSGAVVVLAPRPADGDEEQVLPGAAAADCLLRLEGEEVVAWTGLAALPPAADLGSGGLRRAGGGRAFPAEAVRRPLGSGREAREAFLAAREEWRLLKAAMLAGLGRQALVMAAAYSCERQQFGKAIGSFQGIAHPLADALTEIDGAQLLVWHAVSSLAEGNADAAALGAMAWWWAAGASGDAAARALHTFGGYGVSLEYDIQLYYRRAKAWALLDGDPQRMLDELADRLWRPGHATPLPQAGPAPVTFGVGTQAEAFGQEVRRFFAAELTPELKARAHHSVAGYHAGFNRKLAQAGLLFPHWPEAYGGRGRTAFDMAALGEAFEEFNWQRITAPITNQVAQIVMRFADEGVKAEVLPRFARGEALACLGFSEPSCGSDVFAARTRAVADGDAWVIDGQKIFTTAGNLADYVFLLTRTDPDLPKHAGLTLFLVPMDLPGIEVQAVHTLQDERTNITYLDGVRVPDRYRVGPVNGGVQVMAATLELEHGGDQYRISFNRMYEDAVRWARETKRAGRPVLEDADARRRLARVAVHVTVARDLCHRAIWAITGQVPGRAAFGPMSKLFSTEYYRQDASDLMDLCAPASLFPGHDGAGQVELGYRQSIGMTIYGGTSEIHRSLIAEQGLGMPRSRT